LYLPHKNIILQWSEMNCKPLKKRFKNKIILEGVGVTSKRLKFTDLKLESESRVSAIIDVEDVERISTEAI